MASCSRTVKTVAGLGALGGLAYVIGGAASEGAGLSACLGLAGEGTVSGSVGVLAHCAMAAQAKEMQCVQSQSQL